MEDQKPSTLSQIAGSIPVVGGIAQSVINAVQSRSNQNRQNAANRSMAEYQYSKDLEMWNRGNEYNAPMAQMDRLKKAGLNPNLVYGSGAVAGQSAQTLPKYQAPEQHYTATPPIQNIPESLSQFQDFRMQNAQLDNLKAQRTNLVLEGIGKDIQNKAMGSPMTLYNGPGGAVRTLPYAQAMKEAQLQKQMQANEVQSKMFPYQLEARKSQNRLIDQSIMKASSQMALMSAQEELAKMHKEMFMPSFWAKTAIGGVNALKGMFGMGAKQASKLRMPDQIKLGKPSQGIPKVDPSNKAWQKEFESHKQWMKRVNPGAN